MGEAVCLKILKTALLTTLYLRWSYAARSVVEGFFFVDQLLTDYPGTGS